MAMSLTAASVMALRRDALAGVPCDMSRAAAFDNLQRAQYRPRRAAAVSMPANAEAARRAAPTRSETC